LFSPLVYNYAHWHTFLSDYGGIAANIPVQTDFAFIQL
jgi:hypothetical protein